MADWYLAARWERQAELQAYRDDLTAIGIRCTSSWLDVVAGSSLASTGDGKTHHDHATNDLADVAGSDKLILFTEKGATPRNGRMVEFGYALGVGIEVAVIGPRENLFCHLSDVQQFDDWPTALHQLTDQRREVG